MTKRIFTRVGDVFCVDKIDGKHKRYFQYIARDLTELNSQVVRVFKSKYPVDSNPDIETIVADEVDFYTHITCFQGLKDGSWERVGKSKNIGDVDNVYFRWCSSIFSKKAYDWYIWKIGGDYIDIGEAVGKYKSISLGGVYPSCQLMHKFKTGKYPCGEDIL